MQLSGITHDIKQTVDFAGATASYGVEYNVRGFARCPFHGEDTPSFKAFDGYGHCFGCGWHGDIIAFVRKQYNLSFVDAIKKLNDDFRLGLPLEKQSMAEQYAAKKRADAIKAKQAKERKRREMQNKAYNMILARLIDADKRKGQYAPKRDDDNPCQEFLQACFDYERYSDMLDEFCALLWQAKQTKTA